MKKYTITDNQGNKKTVYAKDLAHAITFVDNKVKDAVSLIKGDWFTLRRENDILYKVIDDQRKTINGFREAMMVEVYRITFTKDYKDYIIKKVGNESFHPDRWSSSDIIRFNSAEEAMNWLKRQLQLTKHRVDSKVKDAVEDDALEGEYHTEYGDKLIVSKVNASTYSYFDVDTKHVIRVSINALKADIKAKRLIKDSTKDEANLPTTIQALVNDEEAAIKAYEVAIKNLEGKIDETARQVLINIMKDERRHVENLYAILNGQVTEKNLEDSKIKDEVITIGNTEYRLYSRYGSYHLDELKTNDRVADFDSYSEAMASIRQWKKLGYITDSNDDKLKDAAPGVDKKKFDRLVDYFNIWGKPGRRELQDVIDYYRLNSATAYQLLIYWGYKDEFKKLHFYDSLSKTVK